jgi:hypothetical protein
MIRAQPDIVGLVAPDGTLYDVQQRGKWYFRARECRNGTWANDKKYIGWCAQTPFLGNGPIDIGFDYDVRFQFGSSENEVLGRLKAEVLT